MLLRYRARVRRTARTVATFGVALLLSGCGPGMPDGHLVVFAAASLTKAFTVIGDDFTATNPASPVELSFGGSADLLTQLSHGAPADVFAAADAATMDKAIAAGLVAGQAVTFATNTLTIVVAPGNPKGVRTFSDLTKVSLVVCAPEVPCGASLPGLEKRTGVDLSPVSEESSVTDVMNKVVSGQADAGLAYRTDALAAGGKATAVPFSEATVNTYWIAVLKQARSVSAARRFVDQVTGPAGRSALAAAGFGRP
ncbi:MAG: molybdate ABC transporter substrate-binding protein [Mycobacterium sp.]|nr:molybdate ABC transporter substrate-binding protein [Mycobacterium sp.]